MSNAEHKRILKMACACDRLELRLLCDRQEQGMLAFAESLPGTFLPKVVPWITALWQLRHELFGKVARGSILGRIFRLIVALV